MGRAFLNLPNTYWLLWVGALINRLGGFVFTFLALYLTESVKLSPTAAGAVIAVYGTGSFIAAAVGGTIADRLGRRFGILFGTVTGALAVIVLGFVSSVAAITVASFLAGLLGDSYRASLNAAVADVVPEPDRARAYSFLYWAVNLGFAVAAGSAGWLAKHGYHWLFIIDAITTLSFAFIVFLFFKESKPERKAAAPPPLAWWEPFKQPLFLRFAISQFLVILVFMQSQASLPIAMRANGIGPEVYGSLIACNGVLIIVLQPLSLRLIRGVPLRTLLTLGAVLTGLGFGINAFASTVPIYALSILVWTCGEIAFAASGPAFVSQIAPVHARGVYQGAFQMLWGGGFAVAPLVGTSVMQYFSAVHLWLGCAVVCLVAAFALAQLKTENSSAEATSSIIVE